MEKMSPNSLFQVYLRLRPPPSPLVQLTPQSLYPTLPEPERFLTVERPEKEDATSTHITIRPPSDSRKRAVEKFGFTKVFDERAEQLDIFRGTGVIPLVEGVLGGGRDGLVATLGVTGSGKSHTILGSKTQRGLTQLALDLLYRSIDSKILQPEQRPSLIGSLAATDASEALILSAGMFLDIAYGDGNASRAGTPMMENWQPTNAPKRRLPHHPSALPRFPDISTDQLPVDANAEYAILISMFEVYNDRIFDLLAISNNQKDLRRRPLLFKPTEASPDRKVVAGLRKVVCGSYDEAMMVLETGLIERRVAGTGSNSVSSRSHGFFCVEVKRRPKGGMANSWQGANLSIVDLAGSERARNAKTAGATLAEAGKINESLMYLGQCLQMQSDHQDSSKPTLVPFRQCKLTELLFSNSFPSTTTYHHYTTTAIRPRNPQRATMIVTADPLGDFNATSQILRYSALAREVTVPRIPSVSSTILAGANTSRAPSSSGDPDSRPNSSDSPKAIDSSVVDLAFTELARLNEEIELLSLRLEESESRRREAEQGWARAETKAESMELEIRDEVCRDMEENLEAEKARWRTAWEEEGLRGEERFERKLEILAQGTGIADEDGAAEERESGFERENAILRARVADLEREVLGQKSPSKKAKSPRKKTQGSVLADATAGMNALRLSPTGTMSSKFELKSPVGGEVMVRQDEVPDETMMTVEGGEAEAEKENHAIGEGILPKKKSLFMPLSVAATPTTITATPGRKIRKLTARKLDLMDEEDLEAYYGGGGMV